MFNSTDILTLSRAFARFEPARTWPVLHRISGTLNPVAGREFNSPRTVETDGNVVGAESDARDNALGFPFPRPTVLVVGHEREGLSERVRAQCDALVAIRGGGAVDSLNVGVATGLLVAEIVRGSLAAH